MWIHLVIFMLTAGFLLACRAGWIRTEPLGGRNGIRLFCAVAVLGNILGMAFTVRNGSAAVYDRGYKLEKETSGIYEEEFQVTVDGETEPGASGSRCPGRRRRRKTPRQNLPNRKTTGNRNFSI